MVTKAQLPHEKEKLIIVENEKRGEDVTKSGSIREGEADNPRKDDESAVKK